MDKMVASKAKRDKKPKRLFEIRGRDASGVEFDVDEGGNHAKHKHFNRKSLYRRLSWEENDDEEE